MLSTLTVRLGGFYGGSFQTGAPCKLEKLASYKEESRRGVEVVVLDQIKCLIHRLTR